MKENQIEAAARELCRLRGVDPDQQVAHSADPDKYGCVVDVLLYSSAWRRATREIEEAEQLAKALAAGASVRELVLLDEFNAKRRPA